MELQSMRTRDRWIDGWLDGWIMDEELELDTSVCPEKHPHAR